MFIANIDVSSANAVTVLETSLLWGVTSSGGYSHLMKPAFADNVREGAGNLQVCFTTKDFRRKLFQNSERT